MQNTHMIILNILKIFSKLLPLTFWILILFAFDAPGVAFLTLIAAIIHEMGHLLTLACLNREASLPFSVICGFKIKQKEHLSYNEQIMVYLSGPTINILLFILTLFLENDYIRLFGSINLMTALANLLPVEGYDGYNAIKELLLSVNSTIGLRIIEKLSFIISVFIVFLSLFVLWNIGGGYWIFAMFFISMLAKMKKTGKNTIFKKTRDI